MWCYPPYALHWLPIEYRIKFKILLLTFKSLKGNGPIYLKDLFKFHDSPRQLRSVDSLTLEYPRTNRRSYGDRAFSITEWNKLPDKIKSCSSVNSFKSQLKTHLFTIHFDWFLKPKFFHMINTVLLFFFLTVYNVHWISGLLRLQSASEHFAIDF